MGRYQLDTCAPDDDRKRHEKQEEGKQKQKVDQYRADGDRIEENGAGVEATNTQGATWSCRI